MAEEAKKEGEGENLDSEGEGSQNWTEGTQGDEGKKTTFTLEEVEAMKKKMQSDSDRGVQKILHDKALSDKALDAVWIINDDPNHLVVLSETDPEVAKIILKKYYNGQTIEQYMEEQGIELDLNNTEIVKKRIALEAQKLADERIISEKKDEFIKELKMTDEEKTLFEEAFEERKNLKSFDTKDMRKHLEKAFREINDGSDNSKLRNAEEIARALSTGSGKWASESSSKATSATKKSVDNFFDKYL